MQIRILASKLRLENLGRNAQIGYHIPYILACRLQIDEDADPDPAYHFDADPDPTFYFDADPDPDPQHCFSGCRPDPLFIGVSGIKT